MLSQEVNAYSRIFMPGNTGINKKLLVVFRDIAKIFGNQGYIAQLLLQFMEEVHARSPFLFAIETVLVTIGNGIVLGKAMEVVNADRVKELTVMPDPVNPPAIVILSSAVSSHRQDCPRAVPPY